MPVVRNFNIGGVNLYVNPLLRKDGELLQAVNVDSYPYGAKSKRAGYTTYLGTANGEPITNLFSWTKDNGDIFTYRSSGTLLYYSVGGTGAWTVAGNGTVASGNYIGHAVLDNVLCITDGAGTMRHSTNGSVFVDGTLAPVGVDVCQYQNRIYVAGTTSDLFYSTTNDATNWSGAGTSDSSSLKIPGAGKLKKIFVASDRLIANKTSGKQFKWDGYSLVDTGSTNGVTSPWSVAETEGYYFYLNRLGHQGYGGGKPQLLSNAIQPQIYNNSGSAIAGTMFDTASAGVLKHNYFLAVGTITDDYGNVTINDAIINYNYQTNEYLNYSYAVFPKAFHTFKDVNGVDKMIFGGAGGQVYQLSGTATADNTLPISSVIEFVVHGDAPDRDKLFKKIKLYFNPGCNAKCQVAVSDHFVKGDINKKWIELGSANTGVAELSLPQGSNRGRFMFVKIYESSTTSRYTFYGYSYEAEIVGNP